VTLLRAAGGSGKTTLARAWRDSVQARGGRMAWLSLTELHRDPTFFVESLVEAIRAAISDPLEEVPTFGDEVVRALPRSTQASAPVIVDSLCRALRTLTRPLIVCFDAFESLEAGGLAVEIVDQLLRARPAPLHVVLTTRGPAPGVLARMISEGEAEVFDGFALGLRAAQIVGVLRDEGVELAESELVQLLARTRGWAIAVRFAARALAAAPPRDHPAILRRLGSDTDLFRYIASELIERVSPELARVLEVASLLGPVDRETLTEAIGAGDARARVDRALESGLLQSSGGHLVVHDLLAEWLRHRMRETLAPDELRALQVRLGELLERNGHAFEALRLLRIAERGESIGGLLARHGHDWVADGHRELVADALRFFFNDAGATEISPLSLQGAVPSCDDLAEAIDRLKQAIEMYRRAGHRRAEFEAFHQLSVIAMNENRMPEVMNVYRHALTLRGVLLEPGLRGFLVTALGLGSFVVGRHRMALRLLATADTYDLHPRERGGVGLVRSLIFFLQGDWDRVVSEVDERCSDERQRRHGTTYQAMQSYRAAVLGFRGIDVEANRATLEDAIRHFTACRHSLLAARAHLIAGQLAARAVDREAAVGHFTRAAALGQRIRLREGEAAALGHLARVQHAFGDLDGALASARAALGLFVDGGVGFRRAGVAPYFATGCALAALVAAESGDPGLAVRFLEANGRALRFDSLPLCGHAIGLMRARAYALAGSTERARSIWTEAERIRRRSGIGDLAPELDPETVRWSQRQTARDDPTAGAQATRAVTGSVDSEGRLELKTLGGLDVVRNGRPVPLRDWKGTTTRRLLVRLLVAEGRWLAREQVEADLWPEADPANARNNLRVALSRLRDVLEPRRRRGVPSRILCVEGERLALGDDLLARWDVRTRREALHELERATAAGDAERASAALSALAGDSASVFAPEIYDDWASELRRAQEAEWARSAGRIAARWLEIGRPDLAERVAAMLLEGAREDELAWGLLGEARLAQGDRSGAARAYHEGTRRIRDALGIEPGQPLRRLGRALGLVDAS